MGTKEREVVTQSQDEAWFTRYIGSTLITENDYQPTSLGYRQYTVSEDHLFHRAREYGVWGDFGGPFYTEKVSFEGDLKPYLLRRGGRTSFGPIFAKKSVENRFNDLNQSSSLGPDVDLPIDNPAVHGDILTAYGTTAIARTIPTNPIFDAATFVGELREGLPSLFGSAFLRSPSLSALARENLNWEFGVKPFVNDMKSFVTASQEAETRLEQLRRDEGRPVRRRYAFPQEVEESSEVSTGVYASGSLVGGSTFLQQQGVLTETVRTERDIWFSGCYQYTLPPEGSNLRRIQELDFLYGARPSLDTLWNLTPWTWCLDWFSNAGDVATNLSAFSQDGLLLKYGYVMCRSRRTKTYTWEGLVQDSSTVNTFVPHRAEQVIAYETKQRIPATPYGFGLTFGDLTSRQWGILSSLGILQSSHLT